jgi:hypothetical protein
MRMRNRRLRDVLVLTLCMWALAVPAAHAYIDAGSTSVIFQAVVAGIAAGWMFVKLFWQRLVRRLRGDGPAQEHEEPATPTPGPEDGAPRR